jgi:hypothetical protein
MDEEFEEVVEDEEDIKNDQWFKENYVELVGLHPKEWIAVIDQKIIATGTTMADLDENAMKVAGERKFSIYFVPGTIF